jgi:hypothetical protein
MVMAWHPGDDRFAYAEQPCAIKLPDLSKNGLEQKLTFKPIADIQADIRRVPLDASSDSGLPVSFSVIEGPAELSGNHELEIHAAPPRSNWPLRVTVAAWQAGRATEPQIRVAEPVMQSFLIHQSP